MATLYLTEQHTTVRREQNRLVVEREGKVLGSVHDFNLERVVVYGSVQLTTAVIEHLLVNGIDTVFIGRGGKYKGRLAPLESKNVLLREKQFERTREAGFALRIAQAVVAGKLNNCREVLLRYQRNHPELEFKKETDRLMGYVQRVATAGSPESLLGLEGSAATVYFAGFAKMFRSELKFDQRVRRPPTDPINSMLGLGYTLLANEGISAVAAVGFDPYFGFYHKLDYGRCSLALDLIEEFRPITVDRLVSQLVNLGMVANHSFTAGEDGAVWLKDEARKRFFVEYERMLTEEFTHGRTGGKISFRRAIQEQAHALQRAVMRGELYRSFQGWH
ncbi:MAG: CRISPR-associated endonuclease Cas1 [Blastocatellia bacterium]|nr:CRISPR-associated endonuclease Cas1 [Blastocatellia bacterium]